MSRLSAALVLLAASPASQAVIVHFDYSLDSSNFFASHPGSQAALEAAGQFFEQNLTDSLEAIASVGANHFDAEPANPATGAPLTISDYSVAADTLVVYVGARDLPAGVLGEGGPGGWSARGSQAFLETAGKRGQGETQGPAAVDFAPWGGSVSFSGTAPWYFDPDPATREDFAGRHDFYSVALHELGHVFGIGTADAWFNQVAGGAFTGANAKAANGGADVALADSSHWAAGTQSPYAGASQEAAMTPSLAVGSRKHFTVLDEAGLKDLGWQAAPVPLPPAAWLFAGGVLSLARFLRRPKA